MARRPKSGGKPKKSDDRGAPGIGHNDLTDEQKAALLLQACGKIERLEVQKAAILASIRNERKKAKADGVALEELNYALFLRKADPDAAAAQMRTHLRIAQWLGHQIGFQAELFGDGVDRTPSVEKAFAEGKAAGMAGDAGVVPSKWAPGGEQHEQWMQGWHAGQKVLLSAFEAIPNRDSDLRDPDHDGRADGGLGDAPQRRPIQ